MIPLRHYFRDAAQNHLFGRTACLPRADVALVFGNRHIIDELSDHVARDYHAGLFNRIVTMGGVKTLDGTTTEADALADDLIARFGVPNEFIYRETMSRNSLENAICGLDVMKDQFHDHPSYAMIGYGHAKAGMRFLWTMNKIFPSSILMFQQVLPNHIDPENPFANKDFHETCQQQLKRLPFYAHSQYIAPVTLHEINNRVREAITHAPTHPRRDLAA